MKIKIMKSDILSWKFNLLKKKRKAYKFKQRKLK